MSYKCMKNMSQVANSPNSKILKDSVTVQPHQLVKVESVIYRCEVTRTNIGAKETYTGLTGGPFDKG